MNERLRVIATQVKLSGVEFDGVRYYVGTEETFLEFADRVVQECISTLNKRFTGDLNREDMEVRRCIDDVKKHFGVEE